MDAAYEDVEAGEAALRGREMRKKSEALEADLALRDLAPALPEREMLMRQAIRSPEGQGLRGVQHSAVVGVGLRHHDASATVAAIYSDMQLDDAHRALQLENDELRKTCDVLMESHAMQMHALRQQRTRAISLHEAKRKVQASPPPFSPFPP